jgi:hypothetical protein
MIQRSFSSGEVDPALYGRADVDRWKSALKECKNWIVQPEGGIVARQGLELKARFPYANASLDYDRRLIPFEFGPSDSYVQVWDPVSSGTSQMWLVRNGVAATGSVSVVGTLNKAVAPNVVTVASNPMVTGDQVKAYTSVLAGNTYTVTYINTTSFSLDGTTATAGTEPILFASLTIGLEVPLASAAVAYRTSDLRYIQSGDTQYFTCGVQYPLKLTRTTTGSGSLDLETLSFTNDFVFGYPDTPTTSTLSVTSGGGAGTETLRYRVTVSDKDGIESCVLRQARVSSTSISGTNTLSITVAAPHTLLTNDKIMVQIQLLDNNGGVVYNAGDMVRVVTTGANTFDIPGNGVSASSSTLYYYRSTASVDSVLTPSSSAAATISWSSVAKAASYNVYREFGRVFGYIGSTLSTSFVDRGIIPDTKDTPILGISPFRREQLNGANFPTAIGLFQQRLMLGGFDDDTERIAGSHIGNYTAFDPGAEDASGLDFGLAGRSVSGIQHLVEIAGRAVVLSNTSEWVLKGSSGGALTPTAINARADSYYGCSDISPAVVGTSLIYVQRGDRIVRDAKYDFSQEALASADLTLWAKHLFKPEVKRLAYQGTSQILWVLRKDGVLLGMTYIPEQNIWGWHQHEIAGRNIDDICVVSEDGTDRLYCSVLDDTHINVCRLPLTWESGDVDDHLGFDMGLFYDGRVAATGTLTGGTLWTTAETLTLTASSSTFVVGDVGKDFLLRLGEDSVYVTCTAYTSGTEVDVTPRTLVPVALRGVASTTFARCASTFSGLDHLEGETVGVIADGNVESTAVVTSGAITTTAAYARVQVGIPMVCQAKTLDLEPDDKDTYLGDFKHVTRVFLRVKDTRGITVGIDESHLNEPPQTYNDVVNGIPPLQSGPVEILMDAIHEESGSVVIRQDTGLPATVLNARPVFNAGELK